MGSLATMQRRQPQSARTGVMCEADRSRKLVGGFREAVHAFGDQAAAAFTSSCRGMLRCCRPADAA
jgi:hypothetical protein